MSHFKSLSINVSLNRTGHRLSLLCFLLLLLAIYAPVAWSQATPTIELAVTLIEDTNAISGDECGTESTLSVPAGTRVEVCYTVTNTSGTTLNMHDLVDTTLGTLLSGFSFSLGPAESVGVSFVVSVSTDTTFTATWTAYNAGPVNVAQSTSSATLTVVQPTIDLAVTLIEDTNAISGDECGTESTLSVPVGTRVEVCYTVTNTSGTTLNMHDLVDTTLGTLLSGFSFSLGPAESVGVSFVVSVSTDTTFTATWTAYNAGPVNVAQSTSSATLTVVQPTIDLAVTLIEDTNAISGDECGTESTLSVPVGTRVEVCYTVTNTSGTTLNMHDLVDTTLGTLLSGFSFSLGPAESVGVSFVVSVSTDTTFTATWTAYNAGPVNVAQSTNSATLTIGDPPAVAIPALRPLMWLLLASLLALIAGLHSRRNMGLG